MPHVIVKLYSGRSEKQKSGIAEAITNAIIASTGNGEESISVAIEDVAPSDWVEKVYKPDIRAKRDTLYKKPGYDPL
jgi:4-oxalocrotonate tautomerase